MKSIILLFFIALAAVLSVFVAAAPTQSSSTTTTTTLAEKVKRENKHTNNKNKLNTNNKLPATTNLLQQQRQQQGVSNALKQAAANHPLTSVEKKLRNKQDKKKGGSADVAAAPSPLTARERAKIARENIRRYDAARESSADSPAARMMRAAAVEKRDQRDGKAAASKKKAFAAQGQEDAEEGIQHKSIQSRHDKLVRSEPKVKGPMVASRNASLGGTAVPTPNPWYHGTSDQFGYSPYGYTSVTNWNVPAAASGIGAVAFFRRSQRVVRIDGSTLTFIDTASGDVLATTNLLCILPQYVIRANATIGYYACYDGTIVLFDVMTQTNLDKFKLPGYNNFNYTDYPYLYDDEEVLFEYVPHLQQNLLLIQVQNKVTNQEAAQIVMLNETSGRVLGFGPILGSCPKVNFVGLTQQSNTPALSAVMVCSTGAYYSFPDPSVSAAAGFEWSTGSIAFRTSPNIQKIAYPPGYPGPFEYYIKSMAFAYLSEANPAAPLSVSEVYTDSSKTVNTDNNIPRNLGACGAPNRHSMQGPAMVLSNVLIFATVCGRFNYDLAAQKLIFTMNPGVNMQFKNLFWGGAGEGAETAGMLIESLVDASSTISIFNVRTGIIQYRNTFSDTVVGIAHVAASAIYKPPGFAEPLAAIPMNTIAVLTANEILVVGLDNGNTLISMALRVPTLTYPVFIPASNSLVVVGTDYSLISYSTLLGVSFYSDNAPTIHEGVTYVAAIAPDYNTYIYALDQAGRVMWKSDRAFGFVAISHAIYNRYVMVVEAPNIAFLDMYTGVTVDVININTNCDPIDPRLAGNIKKIVHSADFTNVYFTAGTKCLYNIGPDLTLSAFALPFRTTNPPVLDNSNNYIFAFEGYNIVALDFNNNGAVMWARDLDNAPLEIIPLSETMDKASYPNYKAEFVYVLCEFGLYALYYPTNGGTQWSYLINNGAMSNKVVSNLLIFNQMAFIKYSSTIVSLSLDPSVDYENRILWTAYTDNDDYDDRTGTERLIATSTGYVIWVGGNDIMVFQSENGGIYLDQTDSCPVGSYGSVLSYDAYLNALAVSCADSITLLNMTTGIEIVTLLGMPDAVAISIRDGVLIAANTLQIFIQAIPPSVMPNMNYFDPLPTVAPASTFAPLPSGAPPIPPPTLPDPFFSGIYNAPPPFVANMTENTVITELRWNTIFSVPNNGVADTIIAQDGFTFAELWRFTVPVYCSVAEISPLGETALNGILVVSCNEIVNSPAPANAVFALNPTTGATLWTKNPFISNAVYYVEGNTEVILRTGDSTLKAVKFTTGETLWSTSTTAPLTSVVTVYGVTPNTDGKGPLIYMLACIDATTTINIISVETGAQISTYGDACQVMTPVLASGQQATSYSQKGLSQFYYMCDTDLKRWDLSSDFTELLISFADEGDAPPGIWWTTNSPAPGTQPTLMVVMNDRFVLYTVEPELTEVFTYAAPDGNQFFGNAAYLAEKQLAIATFSNTDDYNVRFVAINITNTSSAELLWENFAGSYNFLVVSKMMASAVMLPDDSGNFVYLNGAVFILSAENGNANTQFQGNYVSVSFPNKIDQAFIEGPDYVLQTQTRIVCGSEAVASLIIVDPMLDQSPDAYGWSFSSIEPQGLESFVNPVTKEHLTVVYDEDGIVAQLDDAGYVRWVSNGLKDNSAPLNIYAVGFVSSEAFVPAQNAHPAGYVALIHDHGVTFLKADDGTFVVELENIIDAGISVFASTIQYAVWGDSVYVASQDFLFRFDPVGQKMTFIRVATYPLQFITSIGVISLDGSVVVLNTNLGSIIAINTTSMDSATTASFTALGSPVTGFAPVCANRTAVRRGEADPNFDYFITYSEPTATIMYLRFSDLMVVQMMNEVPGAVFATTEDCHLLVWSQWVMAKFNNVLKDGPINPVWSIQVSFDGEDQEQTVQFTTLPNVGLIALCGMSGEYFTFDYATGDIVAHFKTEGVSIVYNNYFSVAGQGVNVPMIADVIFVDTDYGGAFVKATTGEVISKYVDSNLDIVIPTTNTKTYLYVEFGTLVTISPVPLSATGPSSALNLTPIPTLTVTIPVDYQYTFTPVLTTPFTPAYANASFPLRVWAEPPFNVSTANVHYVGSFIFPYNDVPTVAAVVTISGQGFVQFRDAIDGKVLAPDVPVAYDSEQQSHWIGRFSATVGAYCVSGNNLIGFNIADLSQAATKLFSTQLPASVLINPPYPHSDVPNVPIVSLRNDGVNCMLLTDSKAVCVNTDSTSGGLGSIIIDFFCPGGGAHFAPIFTEPVLNIAVFTCKTSAGVLTMTAYDVTNPSAPAWTHTDNSGTVVGVDGTTSNMVAFVTDTAASKTGAYMVPFATGVKRDTFFVNNLVQLSACDAWEQEITYAIFTARTADMPNYMNITAIDLTNGKLLWSQAPPSVVPYSDTWAALSLTSSLDQAGGNWISIVVFNTGAVCSFDVDDGHNDWCVLTPLAETSEYLEMYENGFLLWGQPDTNLVEFRNLMEPTASWLLSTNNDYSDLAHSLYMFEYNGLTFIHRAFSTRVVSYVVQTERSAIFPGYSIADVLTERFVIMMNPSDATMAVYDTVLDDLMWGVQFYSRTKLELTISPCLYAPNDAPATVVLAYTNDAIVGLSAVDGSVSFVVTIPFCNGGLSTIQSSFWDEERGYLYIGYGTCLLSVSAVDGSYTQTDLGTFVGRTLLMTEHCFIVVSLFGDTTCFPVPVNGVIATTPKWIDSVGVYTSDFDINQYGSFLVFSWTDNQVMLNEINGQRVFERNTKDNDVEVEVYANFLVVVSNDGITVLDLTISTPVEKRTLLHWPASYLVPNPLNTDYLSPSRPVVTPWGVAVAEVRQRIFGIDLGTLTMTFNETSYSTLESLKQTPCNYIYAAPDKNDTWQTVVQREVMTCDGNAHSALTGATLAQAPPLSFTFSNRAALFPNGQSVSEFIIAGFLDGTYLSELPFSWLKYVVSGKVPEPFPTVPLPTGTLDPNFSPQTQYNPPAPLPPGVTLPDNGCGFAIENQRILYDACIEQIILLQQRRENAADGANGQCGTDIAPALLACATQWIEGMPPKCGASTQYLAIAANAAKASPAFPWCTSAAACKDGKSADVCAAFDTTIAYNKDGATPFPDAPLPPPAGVVPIYSSMAPNTMPPATKSYRYYSFHAVAPQGKEQQAVNALPSALMSVLGIEALPRITVANYSVSSTFDFIFTDDAIAYAFSSTLAQKLVSDYGKTTADLGLVAVSFTPYGAVDPPTPPPMTTLPPTTTTEVPPFTTPATLAFYRFQCTLANTAVPDDLSERIGDLLNIDYDPNVLIDNVTFSSFDFEFTNYYAAGTLSPQIYNLVQSNAARVAEILGVSTIDAVPYVPSPPTTLPPSPEDADDARPEINGAAAAGLAILVIVAVAIGGLLVYVFVIKNRDKRRDGGDEGIEDAMVVHQEAV